MPLKGSGNRTSGKLLRLQNQADVGPVADGGIDGYINKKRAQPYSPAKQVTATGGTVTTYTDISPAFGSSTYKIHTFTSSGSFVVSQGPGGEEYDIQYFVLGGGGGSPDAPQGGNRESGSGGGGALLNTAGAPFPAATYPISVGSGGNGGNGGNSVITCPGPSGGVTQTALGGGRGGSADGVNGNPGGNGGGAFYTGAQGGEGVQTSPGGGSTVVGTYDGYPGSSDPEYGGSGGGLGGNGGRGNSPGPGATNNMRTGSNVTYGAGGVASNYPGTNRTASGGANTGDGGSGQGDGGSGIVVIKYIQNS